MPLNQASDCSHLIVAAASSKDWVDYLSAALVPVIALLGSFIAYRQMKNDSNRLKHELFDRRYAQFMAIKEFLGSIITYGKCKPDEQLKFMVATTGVLFTFDKEIEIYLTKEIWEPAVDLECLESELQGLPVGEERTKNIKRQAEIKKELYKKLTTLEDKFVKYLQLKH